TGRVMVISAPALATGGWFTAAAFTIIFTVSWAMAPALSVTFSWKVYTPATRLFTTVLAEDALTIVNCVGPLNLVHRSDEIVPSGSLDPLPSIDTEFTGNVIFKSEPALAIGDLFAGTLAPKVILLFNK